MGKEVDFYLLQKKVFGPNQPKRPQGIEYPLTLPKKKEVIPEK